MSTFDTITYIAIFFEIQNVSIQRYNMVQK